MDNFYPTEKVTEARKEEIIRIFNGIAKEKFSDGSVELLYPMPDLVTMSHYSDEELLNTECAFNGKVFGKIVKVDSELPRINTHSGYDAIANRVKRWYFISITDLDLLLANEGTLPEFIGLKPDYTNAVLHP